MGEINVRYADMPVSIKAYTISNADSSFTVILNSKHTREQHLTSYYHEVNHIKNGDYDKKLGADIIELYAHK